MSDARSPSKSGSLLTGPDPLRSFVHPACQDEWEKYGYDPDRPVPCTDCAVHLGAAYEMEELQQQLKDCGSALSQAEAAARAYQDDLRDARAEARYGR